MKLKLAVIFFMCIAMKAHAQPGYDIKVTVTPLKNCWLYLGGYYGKFKNLVDSAWLNEKSEGVFKADNKLTSGIYFTVSPQKTILSEFLVDSNQHFTIVSDTANASANTFITGSKENSLYQGYTKFLSSKISRLTAAQTKLKTVKTAADSAKLQTEIAGINKEMNAYRETVINEHPASMLALFFKAVKRPDAPAKANNVTAAKFVKEHYWDDVDFSDDRLLHTPFFEPKMDEYLKYYVSPEPDSVTAEINYMLLYARTGKEMFKYLLGKFTDKYINPEIMGQDKVFLFLFENYYAKGDTGWLSAKQKEYIFNRAYSLIANQIGEPAPVLNLLDTADKPIPLYSLKGKFTFVVFWDPNCGHCKEEVPQVDSIYNAKWKREGVQVYAVNVADNTMPEWKKFIIEHKLNTWTHVYEPTATRKKEESEGKANYRQLYDVFQTPTMYLLDANKHIIAKRLTILQFDEVMDAKNKNAAATKKS